MHVDMFATVEHLNKKKKKKQIIAMEKLEQNSVVIIPALDKRVREILLRLGEPVLLFGEKEWERQDRLRVILADHPDAREVMNPIDDGDMLVRGKSNPDQVDYEYPFYTEGTEQLVHARKFIAQFSVDKASRRLDLERRRGDWNDVGEMDSTHSSSNGYGSVDWHLDVSEIESSNNCYGSSRPLSGCSLSRNGELLATCSFNGEGKIWRIVRAQEKLALEVLHVLKGHTDRATDICFLHTDTSAAPLVVATGSADCTAKLWGVEQDAPAPLMTLRGHTQRLARLAFHPSGRYLGTASFDETWRLWDIESGTELLQQEGHYRSVYGIDFHPDGSLAASTGMDCLAKIWDLRTGRNIINFEGHALPVSGVAFSPNGYHLATCSEDNQCLIWDLRKRQSLYRIPAHSKLISQVRFEPRQGSYILTASHDKTCRVWSSQDFRLISTLSGHDEIVSASDIMDDGEQIVSVAHDRTIKLWSKSCDDMIS